jgi:23S rRNA maturation-related 3'-5' exoribonuclease YhaM
MVKRKQREVIKIHQLKKNRQHNGQKKKYKQRSAKHTNKTKDRVTRTPLKTRDELRCPGRVSYHSQDVNNVGYKISTTVHNNESKFTNCRMKE